MKVPNRYFCFPFFAGILFFATFLSAGDRSRDLEKLKKDYQAAVERAMDPVNRRHVDELETLLKRAVFDGDLDTAIKVREELKRMRNSGGKTSSLAASLFVGQWEYEYKGRTYRRIIYGDGTVGLWRDGKEWLQSSGVPYWNNFTWRPDGEVIAIFSGTGQKMYRWELVENDSVRQMDLRSGKYEKFVRRDKEWK